MVDNSRSIDAILNVTTSLTIETVIGIVSLLLNGTVIYLIYRKSPPELKYYRYILFFITFSDLILDVVMLFLVRPITVFPGMGAIVTGPLRFLGQPLGGIISIVAIDFCVITSMCTVTIAFLFRYISLVKSQHVKRIFFSWQIQMLFFFITLAGCVAVSGTEMLGWKDREFFLSVLYVQVPELRGLLNEECIFGFVGWNDPFFITAAIFILSLFIINTIAAFAIVKHLSQFRHSLSKETYTAHWHMTIALIVQTISPIILLCVPTCIICISASLRDLSFTTSSFGSMLIIATSLHPPLNALCTLAFVKPYRHALKRCLMAVVDRRQTKLFPTNSDLRLNAISTVTMPVIDNS